MLVEISLAVGVTALLSSFIFYFIMKLYFTKKKRDLDLENQQEDQTNVSLLSIERCVANIPILVKQQEQQICERASQASTTLEKRIDHVKQEINDQKQWLIRKTLFTVLELKIDSIAKQQSQNGNILNNIQQAISRLEKSDDEMLRMLNSQGKEVVGELNSPSLFEMAVGRPEGAITFTSTSTYHCGQALTEVLVKSLTCKVAKGQHRFIIGSKRSGIEEIFRDTDVVVEVPALDEESDTLTLIGPVNKLGDALALVYAKASSVVSAEISYQEWMRRFLIGPKGATLQSLVPKQDKLKLEFEDGGLIYLEGPPEAVKAAKTALNAEISRLTKELSSEVVKVAPGLHGHIIGRNGSLVNKLEDDNDVKITRPNQTSPSEIRIEGKKEGVNKAVAAIQEIVKHLGQEKLREKYPSVQIVFPLESDQEHQILLIGKKDEVDAVKKIYEKQILDLKETVEIFAEVDHKYHRHFMARSGEVLKEIQNQNGGCLISFHRQESGGSKVSIKGSKSCVESAKARLEEIVEDLQAKLTIKVEIAEQHHRYLMPHLNDLRTQYNVRIKVPDRGATNEGGLQVDGIGAADLVQISGRDTKCEEVRKALIALIPIPRRYRREKRAHQDDHQVKAPDAKSIKEWYGKFKEGRGGEEVRALMAVHTVRVKIPTANKQSEEIAVSGTNENVDLAIADIQERVAELDRLSDDRKLRSFKISLEVPLKYHQRLIGPGGARVREISERHKVHISIPRRMPTGSRLRVHGDTTSGSGCSFHPRLIGARGRNLRKVEEDFGVEIRTPGRGDPRPDVITVTGKSEDAVFDCIDKLRNDEEGFISELAKRCAFRREPEPKHEPKVQQQQAQITGAPRHQFPAMNNSLGGA
uniref:K Homology domain-containing protein n=1 Tax=Ditylenchus dipsaci TaxID=166011 RepID=A0A915EMX8_9BILA